MTPPSTDSPIPMSRWFNTAGSCQLDQALSEPVMLTKQSHPSHVILSAQTCEYLMDRLSLFEDGILGQAAEKEIQQSQRVGSERFMLELECLANG